MNLNHALIEKRPEGVTRHNKLIVQRDNASAHKAKPVQNSIKAF